MNGTTATGLKLFEVLGRPGDEPLPSSGLPSKRLPSASIQAKPGCHLGGIQDWPRQATWSKIKQHIAHADGGFQLPEQTPNEGDPWLGAGGFQLLKRFVHRKLQ